MLLVAAVPAARALFSARTTAPGSSWSSGALALTDSDGGVTLFTSPIVPRGGTTGDRCITVSYQGSGQVAVRLYATATVDAGFDSYLRLTVTEGTGSTDAACTGFSSTSTLYSNGTLAAFPTGYASGLSSWAPSNGQSRSYRVSFTLDGSTPASMQGALAQVGFTWEVRGGT